MTIEPKANPQTPTSMLIEQAKWFRRLHDAAMAIAEYLANRPIDDKELAALIQRWESIRQEGKWGHLQTPLKADDITEEFAQWFFQLDEAARVIAHYVALRPIEDPWLAELTQKYLEIGDENTKDEPEMN